MAEENYKSFVYDKNENFNIQYITSEVIIHFRPSKDWKGLGYGFDWMRLDDYYKHVKKKSETKGDKSYKDLMAKQYRPKKELDDDKYDLLIDGKMHTLEKDLNECDGVFIKDTESFKSLEKAYKFHDVLSRRTKTKDGHLSFARYYCSWMSIYPEKSATLSLLVDADSKGDEIPSDFRLEYDSQYFEISPIETTLANLKKGLNVLPDSIEIKCIKEFEKDQTISIFLVTETGKKLAGKLYVWANDATKRKQANVLGIELTTIKTQKESEEEISENLFSEYYSGSNEYLKQALVELKDTQIIRLDLSNAPRFLPKEDGGTGEYCVYLPHKDQEDPVLIAKYAGGSHFEDDSPFTEEEKKG